MIFTNGRSLFSRYARDQRGATAVLVAVLMLVLLGVTAFVLDISKIATVRSRAQQALDAAGLAATGSAGQLDVATEANNFFNANFRQGYLGTSFDRVSVSISADGSTYTYTTRAVVPFTLAQIFVARAGQEIRILTQVQRDNSPFEIAIVADNGKAMANAYAGGLTRKQAMQQGLTAMVNAVYGSRESVNGAVISIINYADATRLNPNISNNFLNLPYPPGFNDGCITNRKNGNDSSDLAPGSDLETRYWRYGGALFSSNEYVNAQYALGGAGLNMFDLLRINFTGPRTLTPNLLVSYRIPHLWYALQNNGYRIFTQDPSLSYSPSYSPNSSGLYNGYSIPFGLPQTAFPGGRFDPTIDAITRDINGNQLYSLNSGGTIDPWQPEQFQIDLGGAFPTTMNNFQMYNFFDRTQCDGPLSAEGEWNAFNFEDGFGPLTNKPHFQIFKTFARVVPVDLSYSNTFRQINIEPVPVSGHPTCYNIPAGGPWPIFSQVFCPGGQGTCSIQDGSGFGVTSFDYYPGCSVPISQFFQNSRGNLTGYFATAFTTNGYSRSNLGMIWAFNTLSPNWRNVIVPGNNTLPRNYGQGQKIAILMTGGNNFPGQAGNDNNFTINTCNAMKAKGITVMTVSLNPGDAGLSSMLAACASGPEYNYTPATLGDLTRAFTDISQKVVRLRIVR